jgi:long-chain acyl-CoA synthetase
VQLFEALEERLGLGLNEEEYARVETLGGLRQFITHRGKTEVEINRRPIAQPEDSQNLNGSNRTAAMQEFETQKQPESRSWPAVRYLYLHWPWLRPLRWIRAAFVECVLRPLVWLLAAPRVIWTSRTQTLDVKNPMLIIANHVTTYDVPLLLFALPRAIRNCTAVAMSGERLEDFRHARNMGPRWLNPLGPPAWLLITALFNVFPLPRQRGFQRGFAHAGRALDRGFHVIVFPEGRRSPDGALASFRPGIGLLIKQSSAAVLPMALHGLGELKTGQRRWFRSGSVEVRVGQPLRFAANELENVITARLHSEIDKLLTGN